MEADFDLVKKIVGEVIEGMEGCTKKVVDMVHRDDYEDFLVMFDDITYCPIRDKLIATFDNDPDGDIRREIGYLIRHAEVVDEFNEYFDINEAEEEEGTVEDVDMGI